MKIFFILLAVYAITFMAVLRCHLTIAYVAFPFLLMLPLTEMAQIAAVQRKEMRRSLTDMHTHFHKRYASLFRTIVGTYVVLGAWCLYLLLTLETCSVELSVGTLGVMVVLTAWYAWGYAQFRGVHRPGLL